MDNSSHVLYPKDTSSDPENTKKEVNLSRLIKDETKSVDKDFKENYILEIIKTLTVSIIFFIFFVFLAALIIVIGTHVNSKKDISTQNQEIFSEVQTRNKERIANLKKLKNSLENYYNKHLSYPKAKNIEADLINAGLINEITKDPLNEVPFKYVYAVYDNRIGDNQSYIISANLEDENGNITPFTIGSPTIYHHDFRETKEENVTYIPIEKIPEKIPKIKKQS